ncbi:MAG: ABC transporter ATP-binding protein [Xanthomonadales bacterium]|nr:ABC transporter ATP-binding protein [Xanthomonadales bacterium]
MIRLEKVTVHGPAAPLIGDVSLTVDAAPLVIIGPSGAGKTTLLHTMLGLRRYDGRILFDEQPAHELSRRARARWLAWLPQQAVPSEPLETLDYLLGARFAYDEPRETSRGLIREALADCGVAHLAERRVTEVSGGEFQRVLLAGLLAQDARYLLLDEPANHLDPALRLTLYSLLARQVRQGRGLIAVTHEIGLITALEQACDGPLQVVGLSAGRLAFVAASDDADLDQRLSELYGIPHRRVEIDGKRFFLSGLGS